jgi:nitrous oxide reductase
MIRDLRDSRTNRRKFLRNLAAAGGLAAVAATTTGTAADATPAASKEQPKRRTGYRVTEHVSKYYDKARF